MSMGLCGNFPPQYSASVTFGTDPYDLFAVLSWLLFGIAQISLYPFNFNHKIYCHVSHIDTRDLLYRLKNHAVIGISQVIFNNRKLLFLIIGNPGEFIDYDCFVSNIIWRVKESDTILQKRIRVSIFRVWWSFFSKPFPVFFYNFLSPERPRYER